MSIVKMWRQQWQKRSLRTPGGKVLKRRQAPEASLNVESLEVRLVPTGGAVVQGLNASSFVNGQHFSSPAGVFPTSTSVSSNPNPSTEGQFVAFTATVSGVSGAFTGMVDFSDSTTDFGDAPLDDSGTAILDISALPVGTTSVMATYLGDSINAGSFGSTDQTVLASTTTNLVGNPNPSVEGQLVTFTAVVSGDAGTPTGEVDFSDSTTDFGTAPLDGSGIATMQIGSLPSGTTTITAIYLGDDTNAGSFANTDQVVTAATTTVVSGNPNPSTEGQTVTFTALVSGDAGTPTGLVDFSDSSTDFGTAPLDGNGLASMQISSLPAGTTTITATYEGDPNNGPSQGATDQSVVGSTTTTVSGNPNPSTLGQSVTFKAVVSGSAGVPTGSVDFSDSTTDFGTVPLDGAGTATMQIASLPEGTTTLTATYEGDANNTASNGTTDQVVNPIPVATTTTVSGTPNPSTLNQSVTFTATVSTASGTPTGSITFTEGSTNLGSAPLNGTGQASIQVTSLPQGPNTLTATYSGDANFATSFGTTNQVVNSPLATTTTVSGTPNPSTLNQSVTFTATVSTTSGTPTGSITFTEGSANLGTAPVNGTGQASIQVTSLSQGPNTITATYSGDANFATSFGTTNQVVNSALASTTTTVSGTPNPSMPNQAVSFTVAVSSASGIPTGTVEITDGATNLGTAILNGSGRATIQVSSLPLGSTTITATYQGNTNFAGSSGSTSQVVSQAAATLTSISSTPNPSFLGQFVTFTVKVTSAAGTPTGIVHFTDGTFDLGNATVDGTGTATRQVSSLVVGTDTITATYEGSAFFTSSVASTTQVVGPLPSGTSTSLSVSPNPAAPGQSVMFMATVTSTAGIPTGLVNFSEGTTSFGSVSLNSSGQATLQVSTLSLGAHNITATYQSNTTFFGSASTVPLTIQTTVVSPNTIYVTQLYQDLLQRSPDPQGLASWVQQIDSGIDRTFVAYDFEQSFERRTLVINAVYQATLLRAPDPTGFNNSMLFLEGGDTSRQLQALLQGSPEYFIVRGHGTQLGFLNSIYLDSLGRLPGASTQAALPLLNAGYSHLALADEVATSAEADSRFVLTVYTLFLGRQVDPASLQTWIDFIVKGGKDDQVVAGILGSDEFFQNAQNA